MSGEGGCDRPAPFRGRKGTTRRSSSEGLLVLVTSEILPRPRPPRRALLRPGRPAGPHGPPHQRSNRPRRARACPNGRSWTLARQATKSAPMQAPGLRRRLIGLFAAYLVALQALVLPLSMPPTAAISGSLCLTQRPGDPGRHPADHDHGCPCCAGCGMQCHAPALALAPPVPVLAQQPRVVAVLLPPPPWMPPPPAFRAPQVPRGPPAA